MPGAAVSGRGQPPQCRRQARASPIPPATSKLDVRARFPGAAGNGRVTITLNLSPNRLDTERDPPVVRGALDRDLVYIEFPGTADSRNGFYMAARDPVTRAWSFTPAVASGAVGMSALGTDGTTVRTVTATVSYEPASGDLPTFVAADLALDPAHKRGGAPDSLFDYFAQTPASLSRSRSIPIVIEAGAANDGLAVLSRIFEAYAVAHPPSSPTAPPAIIANLTAPVVTPSPAAGRSITILLDQGSDGLIPSATDYEGTVNATTDRATGLKAFEGIEDISIVAAPGSTAGEGATAEGVARSVIGLLISHAERMQYRIAVIDSRKGQSIADVRALRALYDSSHAAFYYPWVRIIDPVTQQENHYPPSGFVAGIYARNDVERAVYKAPANEVVNLALGFETLLNKAQQEVLNPEGINCFRYFEGRGMRLWGARTMSSDPEWKYVNLRRYFAFLERSIDKGTQWAVFEPNGERLWANVRRTIQDFLLDQWQTGALLGDKPEKAYFVKCDRSTMSQNDLDNGRLVCQVGVAALRPAEFVIFQIGQWTADFKA